MNKSCRYEPEINPTYQEMAVHYGLGVIPAGVQVAQRWIVAALRHRKLFSLAELNQAIGVGKSYWRARWRTRPAATVTTSIIRGRRPLFRGLGPTAA